MNIHSRNPSITRHESHNIEKIGLCLLLIFGMSLIALTCNFFYEFLGTYKEELNTTLFTFAMIATGLIALLLLAWVIFIIAMLWLRVQDKRAENAHNREKLNHETINNRLVDATQRQLDNGLIYLSEQTTEYGKVKFKSLSSRPEVKTPPLALSPVLELPDIKNTLLDDIAPLQRLLIIGGQNTGKTTLLKHIAKQREQNSDVLIIDSHNTQGKWNNNYRIVGHGRDYKAIEIELNSLVSLMDSRYKELASGKVKEREHSIITVISDEWTTVSKNLNNLDAVLLPLLTESRKVGIDFILATHSETAQSLGIKGAYDLKNNFDATLKLSLENKKRFVHIGENKYHHCGAFIDSNNQAKEPSFNDSLDAILDPVAIKEQAIIQIFNQLKADNTFSWNKLSKAIYGYTNQKKIDALKQALTANSISF